MKKFLSLKLAMAMTLSSALLTVNAGQATDQSNQVNIDVQGQYVSSQTAEKIISVDVSWDDMTFTYSGGSQGTWNPQNHTYTGGTQAKWVSKEAAIILKNHSNTAVKASFVFNKSESLNQTITGTFTDLTDNALTLDSADADEYRTEVDGVLAAPTKTTKFSISGDAIAASSKLGQITITFTAVE